MVRFVLAAAGILAPTLAHAGTTPTERGAIVGAVAFGSETVGLLGGGLTGALVGGMACRDGAFECYGPFIGAAFGGGVGALVGAPLGGGLAAHAVGTRPGRVVGWSLAGAGVGLALSVTGLVTESSGLTATGLLTTAVGMPVLAGIAAGTDPVQGPPPNGPVLSVAPGVGRDRVGLVVRVDGW